MYNPIIQIKVFFDKYLLVWVTQYVTEDEGGSFAEYNYDKPKAVEAAVKKQHVINHDVEIRVYLRSDPKKFRILKTK